MIARLSLVASGRSVLSEPILKQGLRTNSFVANYVLFELLGW